MRLIILLSLPIILASCVSGRYVSTRPDATMEKLLADRYECYQESLGRASSASVSGGTASSSSDLSCSSSSFDACLAARGWIGDSSADPAISSTFTVPQSALVSCPRP